MQAPPSDAIALGSAKIIIQVSQHLAGPDALLKACYWYSRDYVCDLGGDTEHRTVTLTPKRPIQFTASEIEQQFTQVVMDFQLRERIIAQTSDIRDILLAKAFAEAGVMEEQPQGTFGDPLEESKPDGMFRILSNT